MANTRPTTFRELGITFTKDQNCPSCKSGTCHGRATGIHQDIEYYIHVSVYESYCTDACTSTEYSIDVSENSSTFSGNDLNRAFTVELDAINYLLDTFVGFKCNNV